jgi:hypothetical protein
MDPYADQSSIAHRLNFAPGHAFRAKVRDNFATPINPISSSDGFSLVVSFGRTSFDLLITNVSLALSACLGAAYIELRVTPLRDRTFVFDVCSKAIGFMITKMRSHMSEDFICYFDLWGNGGPNWIREEQL